MYSFFSLWLAFLCVFYLRRCCLPEGHGISTFVFFQKPYCFHFHLMCPFFHLGVVFDPGETGVCSASLVCGQHYSETTLIWASGNRLRWLVEPYMGAGVPCLDIRFVFWRVTCKFYLANLATLERSSLQLFRHFHQSLGGILLTHLCFTDLLDSLYLPFLLTPKSTLESSHLRHSSLLSRTPCTSVSIILIV